MKFFGQFRGVKILGETHASKELLPPPGEFHPVSLDAPADPGIEVFSHNAWVGKRFDINKFNTLIINVLNAPISPLNPLDMEGDGRSFYKPLTRLKMAAID